MSKKARIEELERRVSYLVDKIGILEDRLDDTHREVSYLEEMVRHYIALYEQNKTTTTPTIHVYSASVPWPEQAKLQISELQATVAAQTAEINRLIDRVDHLERLIHKYVNEDGK